ncbi:hypothetical protein GCM10011349_45700 [Novosphingobium indicum]|uniref:HTH gntR-type domain-containing protein n=1 Tax=Novosphingobium indicum TaxID=462949 RepID=A0ABQ2K295_9SPHN|nr:GntR family transcriptional regulator [Novosphingobium indicum]GGN62222.1 hypothetical protein GCM10011349_45700 [Novosphingobium indicum]
MNAITRSRTPLEVAAERLRVIILDISEGTLIGSEEELIGLLGCSRSTVRQVARLLEREGLLKVRRGINGGYFSARPNAETIEATVSAYLETLHMKPSDVTVLASALWVEAMRMAVRCDPVQVAAVVKHLQRKVGALKDEATFDDVRKLERETQEAIFKLADSTYIKLIFDINSAFSRRRFADPTLDDESPEHREFVCQWRDAKSLELDALRLGDCDLVLTAARFSRKIWHSGLKRRFRILAEDAASGPGNG